MSTVEEKLARMRELEAEIQARSEQMHELEREVCAELAPFKIGDTIEWGRKRKRRGRVVRIIGSCLDDPKFRRFDYRVVLVRKNGSDGKTERAYYWDNPTKVTAE